MSAISRTSTISGTGIVVSLTEPRHRRTRRLVREHGSLWSFLTHSDQHVPGVLLACRCEGGHGVAGLPVRAWVALGSATMTAQREQHPS